MGAGGGDLTAVQHDDQIGILHRSHALADDQLGGAGDLLGNGLADLCVGLGVHRSGGVVEDQDLGLFHHRPGDT